VTEYGAIVASQTVNCRVCNGIFKISQQEKLEKSTIQKKTDAYSCWDSQCPALEHTQEKGTTINNACYSEMLTDRLKPEIQKQTQRTSVKRCCVVAWQCPSIYCCPHC
jgi:hypothetical protein